MFLDLERGKKGIERQKNNSKNYGKKRTYEEDHKTDADLLLRGLLLHERQAGELKRELEEIESIHS
ncbi:hypothetical protein A7K73_10415 [Candidatus Methylacidiphilum fumarolicum]|uniref:Uncharacterized protein n=2 Tax=Candidatus Methylacidiphilum fumarolicum TaxID=591154 RepID=I0JYH5_METFB|nr:hypothetical protein [Candidatus Methylacidiphilum fumarolicum]TFE66512.1 hypothetical protein A7K73_10415 [Candidatus Methylacidiphilum fumarolicum]TFE76674.1 hypothetical protein A7D33_08800 [Candidatus Methylacidiphilum fumarolicum]CAI9084616.1 conserved protein of unknown function [Candidatus Methylacidiphilum fumarolicum]CCG92294.1 conserved hypothetical protein [Methylacidiphilum fumariolicum SolV]